MDADTPWWWRALEVTPLEEFIHDQHDVVSRRQWLLAGASLATLRRRLRRRDWITVFPGVYYTHRADPPQFAQDVAALLYAGDDAVWCHQTAAMRWGTVKFQQRQISHVLVPWPRRVRRQPLLAVHSSVAVSSRLAQHLTPLRVTAAHATLDRVEDCLTLDDAYAVVADSCQTGQLSIRDLDAALGTRRVRWGADLRRALASLRGSDSLLEVRYVRDVERAHGLPRSARQRRIGDDISDCSYDGYGVLIELDGRLHLLTARRWRDMAKDNRATLRGEATLRYGWLDVDSQACQVALQVLGLLVMRGYRGGAHPCRLDCPVPRRP
jgi:very-short-patch-repair endonuclease